MPIGREPNKTVYPEIRGRNNEIDKYIKSQSKSIQMSTREKVKRNVDDFLQKSQGLPFWRWGKLGHQTHRYCNNCNRRYDDENTTYCPDCNSEWEKDRLENIKKKIYPIRTLKFNDDLILNAPSDPRVYDCCFTHLIGCPSKDFKFKVPDTEDDYIREHHILPVFDWQKPVYEAFQKEQNNLVIKATGIGGSELKLRQTAYAICTGNDYNNTQVPLVVGPEAGLAKIMIQRFKDMFPFQIYTDQSTAEINNCWIHVFASRNIAGLRSLENPRELILDEFDYFPLADMSNVFETVFRYVAKSGAKINAISTVKNPYGYLYTMEHDNPAGMNIIKLHYSVGLGTIYSLEAIEEQKLKPGFEREYCLVYAGITGNYFDHVDIQAAIEPYDLRPYQEATIIMGIDSGWASSWFAVVIMMHLRGKLYVLYSERFKRPYPQFMIDTIAELYRKYYVHKILIDGSDPAFIYTLKDRFKDYPPIATHKTLNNPFDYHNVPQELYPQMKIIPTSFIKKPMVFLNQDRLLLQQRAIKIHPDFKELISGLYEVYVENSNYKKEDKEYNDLVDAFSECCDFFVMKSVYNV